MTAIRPQVSVRTGPEAATDAQRAARLVFAFGMMGLGVLALVYGDFALQWQPVPAWVPWREGVAYASGIVMLGGGLGLLGERTAAASSRVLFLLVLVWWVLLKLPKLAMAPLVESNWLGCGEIGVLLAGSMALFARLTGHANPPWLRWASGERGLGIARVLFGLALPAIGLSHFVYAEQTAMLVPAWLPFRTGWAYLTGAAHVAAGVGVLFGVFPQLAATLEAAMLSVFTLLVWIPAVAAAPTTRLPWTAYTISWAITSGAWLVATAAVGRQQHDE